MQYLILSEWGAQPGHLSMVQLVWVTESKSKPEMAREEELEQRAEGSPSRSRRVLEPRRWLDGTGLAWSASAVEPRFLLHITYPAGRMWFARRDQSRRLLTSTLTWFWYCMWLSSHSMWSSSLVGSLPLVSLGYCWCYWVSVGPSAHPSVSVPLTVIISTKIVHVKELKCMPQFYS